MLHYVENLDRHGCTDEPSSSASEWPEASKRSKVRRVSGGSLDRTCWSTVSRTALRIRLLLSLICAPGTVTLVKLVVEAIPHGPVPIRDSSVVTTRRALPNDVHNIIEGDRGSNPSRAGLTTESPSTSDGRRCCGLKGFTSHGNYDCPEMLGEASSGPRRRDNHSSLIEVMGDVGDPGIRHGEGTEWFRAT
jgi:hypothetical protein